MEKKFLKFVNLLLIGIMIFNLSVIPTIANANAYTIKAALQAKEGKVAPAVSSVAVTHRRISRTRPDVKVAPVISPVAVTHWRISSTGPGDCYLYSPPVTTVKAEYYYQIVKKTCIRWCGRWGRKQYKTEVLASDIESLEKAKQMAAGFEAGIPSQELSAGLVVIAVEPSTTRKTLVTTTSIPYYWSRMTDEGKAKLCITTQTGTREDIQVAFGRQKSITGWRTITTGPVSVTESTSCSLKEVSSTAEIVRKIEETRTWRIGRRFRRTHHAEYRGAYLTADGSTLSSYGYRSKRTAWWRALLGFFVGWILNIVLPGVGTIWTNMVGDLVFLGSLFAVGTVIYRGDITVTLTCFPPIPAPPAPKVSVTAYGCRDVTLTITTENADTYDIYRDGGLIASGVSAFQTSYTDSGLAPHTTYQYKVIARNKFGKSKPATVTAYTKCLPECSFTADKNVVVIPGKATLSWQCQYAKTCRINTNIGEDKGGLKDKGVGPKSGTLDVFPQEKTNFVLTCGNVDGEKSWFIPLEVLKPGIIEVKPR